ncbi:MAG: methylmalonyl-CoA mutase family protein [Dehalococcoidales bacterium]|nr:methylmalonyl-CoA mutase family protein [Dehalococcoidales bacterium]
MAKELDRLVTDWQERHKEEFKKERRPEAEFLSDSGIPIKRVYTPLDLQDKKFDYARDLGMPGDYPYTRDSSAIGRRGQFPTVQSYAGYATPEESNKAWLELIRAGSGLAVIMIAYDLPTQLGYDPDDERAQGEVGRVGISLVSLRDWEIAFKGLDFNKTTVSQVSNALAAVGITSHIALAEAQGVNLKTLHGGCQNDVLKEYVCRGNYIYPIEHAVRLAIDTVSYCAEHAPKFETMQLAGQHFSEYQGTPVHDAAFMLADAFCYIQAALDRGLDIDVIAPGVTFRSGIDHYTFFEEIAKLRAIRKIYSRVLKERFKARKPESIIPKLAAAQGGNSLQREQYLNNIARSTICAMAGLLGGAPNVGLRAYDEQYGIPTAEAMIASTRIMHVVTQETGITDTIDPLAGSYFVESLTAEFEERILHELDTIEKQGGAIRCIENGYMKRKLIQDSYEWQKAFEAGKIIRVGANFANSEEQERPVRVYRADPKVEQERIESVKLLRKRRSNTKVKKALDELKAMASLPATASNNLMPAVKEAVKCYATNGEIAGTLRVVWGEYTQRNII